MHATVPSTEDGTLKKTLLRTFYVDVEPEIVKAFFYIEPEKIIQPVRKVKFFFHCEGCASNSIVPCT